MVLHVLMIIKSFESLTLYVHFSLLMVLMLLKRFKFVYVDVQSFPSNGFNAYKKVSEFFMWIYNFLF